MRVLTLSEPWAWAIVDLAGEGNPAAKIVENRKRSFGGYTGPLAIHSGSGEHYRRVWDVLRQEIRRKTGREIPEFEAIRGRGIIGRCNVVANVVSERGNLAELLDLVEAACEEHAVLFSTAISWIEGPRCLLLADVVRFEKPLEIAGKQGLWSVPDELIFETKGKT